VAADPQIVRGLLIIGCSRRKLATETPVPALDLYQGWFFPQLRARIGESPQHRARVLILSALHGLITADTPLTPYDLRLTPERAAELKPACAHVLAEHQITEDVLLLMEPDYRQALPQLRAIETTKWDDAADVLDSWGWP
jgi:hypothetical protein